MTWERVSDAPALQRDEVHLWRQLLDEPLDAAWQLLSDDERQRADRFSVSAARRRFVQRRAFLRRILASYTGQAPEALAFSYGSMGKPELDGAGEGLEFNQSDSADWTVVAVCIEESVGVDIEIVRPVDTATLAAEVFTVAEQRQLAAESETDHLRAFFNGWTRKEAFIKADGRGLAFPLREVEVSLSPDEPPKLLRVSADHGSVGNWTLLDFEVAPGVIGAVVVQRPVATVRMLDIET